MTPLPARLAATGRRKAQTAIGLTRQHGMPWVIRRVGHSAKLRSGHYERTLPIRSWTDQQISFAEHPELHDPAEYLAYRRREPAAFFFSPTDRAHYSVLLHTFGPCRPPDDDARRAFPLPSAVAEADEILRGEFRHFGLHRFDRGVTPDWHSEPWYNTRTAEDTHWSALNPAGDIKLIWELSRGSWVFPLVRAYWRTGDERYAARFWQLVESWRAANPPNAGVNWRCGQETTFRIMALSFGMYGFLDASATTGDRLLKLASLIEFSAERVEATLDYALNQDNNHGVSEGAGLLTVGLLFPELSRSDHWRRLGRLVVESEVERLVYADGSFSQHSLNYQRVLLDDMVWAQQLCRKADTPLSRTFDGRLDAASRWLRRMIVADDGSAFNVGRSDGASVLPLSDSWYWDYRPTAFAARAAVGADAALGLGPWSEKALWLIGPEHANVGELALPTALHDASESGHVTLSAARSAAVAYLRAPVAFDHRPSEADLFHVSTALAGKLIAIDPGTFSYDAPAPWNNPFAAEDQHNVARLTTPLMERVGKFNFLPWPGLDVHVAANRLSATATHCDEHSKARRVRHVAIPTANSIVIIDRLCLPSPETATLRWSLNGALRWLPTDNGATASIGSSSHVRVRFGSAIAPPGNGHWSQDSTEPTISCFDRAGARPDPETPGDWAAVGYRALVPSPWVELTSGASRDVVFWTLFSSDPEAELQLCAEDFELLYRDASYPGNEARFPLAQ